MINFLLKNLAWLLLVVVPVQANAQEDLGNIEFDAEGYQYKAVKTNSDSTLVVTYFSRTRYEMARICAIKHERDIENFDSLRPELSRLFRSAEPRIKCGIRKFKFGFVYSNGLFDEVRIVHSDYFNLERDRKFKKGLLEHVWEFSFR